MMDGTKRKFLLFLAGGFAFFVSGLFLGASLKNDPSGAACLRAFERGEAERLSGEFNDSIQSFKEALTICRQAGDRTSEAACLMKLGLLHWNIGSMKEASGYYTDALAVSRKSGLKDFADRCRTVLEVIRLFDSGIRHRASADLKRSVDSFKRAVDMSRTIESGEFTVKNLRQLGVAYRDMNEYKNFRTCTEEALKIALKINHRLEEARGLNNLGICDWNEADYSGALRYFQQALPVYKEAMNSQGEADCLYNIGLIYLNLGDYNRAIDYCRRAMRIDRENGEQIDLSYNFNSLGIAFANLAKKTKLKSYYRKAVACYDKCLALSGDHADKQVAIWAMINKANVFYYLGDFDRAAAGLSAAYLKAIKYGDVEATGVSINNLGLVDLEKGPVEEAEKHFLEAIEVLDKIGDVQTLWESHYGLGRCYEKKGDKALAFRHYGISMDNVEGIRSRIPVDVFKVGFARNKLAVYEHALNLLYESKAADPGEPFVEKMFSLVERAKSRAFLESLGEAGKNSQKSSSPGMREREPALAKTGPLRCLRENLLDDQTGLLEYFLGEKKSYLFYITRTKSELFELPPAAAVEISIKGYLKMLRTFDVEKAKGDPAAERIGAELLFPVFGAGARSVKKLIIIPDGILHYLPFEALRIPGDKTLRRKYLIEACEVSYAPSCASLVFLAEREAGGRPKKFLAFGNPVCLRPEGTKGEGHPAAGAILGDVYKGRGFDFSPLPYGRKEVLDIARHFKKKNRDIYLDGRADEEILKRVPLEDYQIVHFACHGLLDEEAPERSALVLSSAGSGEEDGFLQAREISDLRLNADLVVLSACQTARGSLEKREGILGLSRSFFCAGTKSVLSTLWEIRDRSSAVFMDRFYGYLCQGVRKAEALRLAKMQMISSKYAHPFYWAAFVLSGDPGPVDSLSPAGPKALLIRSEQTTAARIRMICRSGRSR